MRAASASRKRWNGNQLSGPHEEKRPCGRFPESMRALAGARRQSMLAPEAFTTWPHFAVSFWMKAANCAGLSA